MIFRNFKKLIKVDPYNSEVIHPNKFLSIHYPVKITHSLIYIKFIRILNGLQC